MFDCFRICRIYFGMFGIFCTINWYFEYDIRILCLFLFIWSWKMWFFEKILQKCEQISYEICSHFCNIFSKNHIFQLHIKRKRHRIRISYSKYQFIVQNIPNMPKYIRQIRKQSNIQFFCLFLFYFVFCIISIMYILYILYIFGILVIMYYIYIYIHAHV